MKKNSLQADQRISLLLSLGAHVALLLLFIYILPEPAAKKLLSDVPDHIVVSNLLVQSPQSLPERVYKPKPSEKPQAVAPTVTRVPVPPEPKQQSPEQRGPEQPATEKKPALTSKKETVTAQQPAINQSFKPDKKDAESTQQPEQKTQSKPEIVLKTAKDQEKVQDRVKKIIEKRQQQITDQAGKQNNPDAEQNAAKSETADKKVNTDTTKQAALMDNQDKIREIIKQFTDQKTPQNTGDTPNKEKTIEPQQTNTTQASTLQRNQAQLAAAMPYVARIKSSVKEHFGVGSVAQMQRFKALKVKLSIVLEPSGRVQSVEVAQSSGDSVFDTMAIRSVLKAERFVIPEDPELFAEYFNSFMIYFKL